MEKITVEVRGMMCGMCEAHINDGVRNAFKVKKVTSSRSKNQTVILTEEDIPDEKIREVISKTGYEVGKISRESGEKKGFFSSLKK